MEDIILSIQNITKLYPGVRAIDDLSLDIHSGEIHALVGENGAGKSTLIKCLSGAVRPDAGEIMLGGNRYSNMTPKLARDSGIEVIYQEINLIDQLSVAENVCFGEEYGTWVSYNTLNEKARAVFQHMGVDIDVTLPVSELTTAYQQLVEIAKSLSKNVKILVMDEPTAPLTDNEVEKLFQIIHRLKEQGVTIIYISHRLDEIFQLADRVSVLRDGRYVATKQVSETDRHELISLMVGRELVETYPRRNNISGERLFEAEHIHNGRSRDVSLHVCRGEIVGLAGLVGAGRTEFARAVFGADKLYGGQLRLNGRAISNRSPKHAIVNGVGYIPEDRKQEGCFLQFPIDWNITISSIRGLSRYGFIQHGRVRELALSYKDLLNIKAPSVEQNVENLSGGNQQKVVLAKTLATQSEFIIFDEPTRGIDVGAKQEIYALMTRLADEGKGILMISSDMEELLGMSDRVYVLSEGELTGELLREEFSQTRVLELASVNG